MILLQVNKVARFFGVDKLFSNITFSIQENSRIGLVGRNGVGKSTLLKIINGQNPPDEGEVSKRKNLSIGYQQQSSGLNLNNTIYSEMLTVFKDLQAQEVELRNLESQMANGDPELLKHYDQLQNDFKNNNGYGYEAEIRSVLAGFSFPEDTHNKKISTLSGGEKSRLALAKLLLEHHDLLLLDEPTNHLDIQTLEWLENYLKSYNGALLIVSHDQYFLDKVVNEIVEIDHHSSTHYSGNYSFYLKEKKKNQELAWKKYNQQQDEIKKLQEFVDKNIVRASTTKQAQSRRKQLEKMEIIEKPQGQMGSARFRFSAKRPSGKDVLAVKDLAVGYDSNNIMSEPINFEVKKDERIGIIGQNGVGKSTLLKTILNIIPALRGNISFGTNVDIGYYDQNIQNLDNKKTVFSQIHDEHPLMTEQEVRSILGSFLFRGDDVTKLVSSLSGGERARLLLTKLNMEHDNFLIMDEPTNHLDIDSKEVLEDALSEFDGTVLFVSHDRYLLNTLATKIIEITPNGSITYLGTYDYYVEKKNENDLLEAAENANTPVEKTISDKKLSYEQSKEKQKQQRKIQREIDELEAQIDKIETRISEINTAMFDEKLVNDYEKMSNLQKELNTLSLQLPELESKWTEKSEELENI
ncbi:ABC-F family ATP-binding cassette domain-containing protein [Companilactobacillus sp. DQM5]|uniref:ABC-F family ATP-binding cassette domain-containing protein n=1 Tax=Companilactobacillus sp. DQM5 TaxID=3463359 RepID=UPI00405987C4